MILFFTLVCIFGGFVLHWRRASLTGYFGSPVNVPGIFTYSLGDVGMGCRVLRIWGAAFALVMASDWPWAGFALVLGFTLRSPILRVVCDPRTLLVQNQPALRTETHFKVIVKKRLQWHGRIPVPDESGDFIAPGGTVQQDLGRAIVSAAVWGVR